MLGPKENKVKIRGTMIFFNIFVLKNLYENIDEVAKYSRFFLFFILMIDSHFNFPSKEKQQKKEPF